MKNRNWVIAMVTAAFLGIIVIGLLGFFSLRFLLREFLYPRPAILPASVTDGVGTALRRFESALAKHAPEVLRGLQPGLSDEEISAVQSKHNIRLTDELRALYRWRDGSLAGLQVQLIPHMRFVSLAEAAWMRDQTRSDVAGQGLAQRMMFELFAGHRKGWLTVLDDGSGDGYFYDDSRRGNAGSYFYCFAEDNTYRFFPSIANFLIGAAECYESGIYRHDKSGTLSEDFERSHSLWRRYASSPGG
jgi:cell wall assembly regulator SMI1